MEKASKALIYGSLLIIDYMLEAQRYYNLARYSGTILSYRNQYTNSDVLSQPGYWDITAHLCLDTLLFYGRKNKWFYLGDVSQGEALLSLGLAQKLYSLQKLSNKDLKIALSKREELLRLVSPSGLGSFYWFAFEKSLFNQTNEIRSTVRTLFLEEPIA